VTPTSVLLLAAIGSCAAAFASTRLRMGQLQAPVAPARGSGAAGVLYAFTVAFAPWSKESASRHLPSYVAGIAYHVAVFTALGALVYTLFGAPLPPFAARAVAVALVPGLVCGAALLLKRCFDARLRATSVPEDFFANALVDLVLAAALAATLAPRFVAAFQIAGAALLAYAPLGKLRHMVLLLISRRAVGATFGRRGVRPSAGAHRG